MYIWAIGILAAGQSSTMTGCYAGQFVMEVCSVNYYINIHNSHIVYILGLFKSSMEPMEKSWVYPTSCYSTHFLCGIF